MKRKTPSICPRLSRTLVIGNDPRLLAQVSSIFNQRKTYLPIIDGPRMQRPDADSEVIRRNNVAARLKPNTIVFAGLPSGIIKQFSKRFPQRLVRDVSTIDEAKNLDIDYPSLADKKFSWGNNRVGLGLLYALRAKQEIELSDHPSDNSMIDGESGHLIACEEGDEFAQVIAANYAYSLDAGLCLIPQLSRKNADSIIEGFYNLYEDNTESPSLVLENFRDELRKLSGLKILQKYRSVTFITRKIPWGFGYPELPTTHLFSYPDLGISVINGILSELAGSPGIRVAVLIDPEKVKAKETSTAIKSLRRRSVFIRGLLSNQATVYKVSKTIELYPYDFLLISSHCGDASGRRLTYQFKDSEGRDRTLVVDEAAGFGRHPQDEKFEVTFFYKFVSLDGVDWNDEEKKKELYVGTAIIDWNKRAHDWDNLRPVKIESIDRVQWSSALRMYDHNYICVTPSLCPYHSPVILNNACASWHRLAETFIFANARTYIGTLFGVTDVEAQDVANHLLDTHFGKPLAIALWRAQNDTYGKSVRRPYVLVGTHFQRLRTTQIDAPHYIATRLKQSYAAKKHELKSTPPEDEAKIQGIGKELEYLEDEIQGIVKRWLT